MLDDDKIIDLFHARSEKAIAELAEKYGNRCRSIAQNILHNPSDAEECVNDAYLAAWNTIPPKQPHPLRTYLYRIVRNISIAKYHANTSSKRNSHYDAALDELEDCLASDVTVEDAMAAGELSQLLNGFLEALPQRERVMFVRRYWYSDSVANIAAELGMSANHAAVKLARLRRKLREYLQKEGVEL